MASGSNLGNRDVNLTQARRELGRSDGILRVDPSVILETDPVGPDAQPRYLNQVLRVSTRLAPRVLLETLLGIEKRMGRERVPGEKWGPRTIDLDLLLYGDKVLDEPGLVVPHPRLHQRRFVLAPLAALAPDIRHPVLGKSARDLLSALPADAR